MFRRPIQKTLLTALTVCATAHCASTGPAVPEVVLEEGGTILLSAIPAATSLVGTEHVEVWAQTQLPGNSRMQAAVTTIQSITRAEFVKLLETHIESYMKDRAAQEGDDFQQEISVETMEHVRAKLSRELPIETGWARVQRGDETHLRMVGRVRLPITEVRGLLEDIPSIDAEMARGILTP